MSQASLIFKAFGNDFDNEKVVKIENGQLTFNLYASNHPMVKKICRRMDLSGKVRTLFYKEGLLVYIGEDTLFYFSLVEKKFLGYYTPSSERFHDNSRTQIFCDDEYGITIINCHQLGGINTMIHLFSTEREVEKFSFPLFYHCCFDLKNRVLYYVTNPTRDTRQVYRCGFDDLEPEYFCEVSRITGQTPDHTLMRFDEATQRLFFRESFNVLKVFDCDGTLLKTISLQNLHPDVKKLSMFWRHKDFFPLSGDRIVFYGADTRVINFDGEIVCKRPLNTGFLSHCEKTGMSAYTTNYTTVTITDSATLSLCDFWTIQNHHKMSESLKKSIETFTTIRSLCEENPICLLPNELLFEIFGYLGA